HAEAGQLGVALYGDLQIGLSHQDVWAWSARLLSGFRMRAPPSRTNPSGQPWSYAVLDPARYASAAVDLVRRRMGKMLQEFDGLLCDGLSAEPYAVERELAGHGLGRFRVTQKVVLDDPADAYRSENAAPADWMMAGTHDTEPVWRVADRWIASGTAGAHAASL